MESTLPPKKIKQYRKWVAAAIPYTEEEFEAIEFDGEIDMDRAAAYFGKIRLEEYGIPLTEEPDEHQ